PAALGVLLAGPHMLVHAVDPLHDDLVPRGEDAEHLGDPTVGGRALVVAGDHFHLVIFANEHSKLALASPGSPARGAGREGGRVGPGAPDVGLEVAGRSRLLQETAGAALVGAAPSPDRVPSRRQPL